MNKSLLLFFAYFLFSISGCWAQSSWYTVLQGGGTVGFSNEGYKGAFGGYTVHFIMGKSFRQTGYLGIGVGNESFKGDYQTNDPHATDQRRYSFAASTFPIFVDGRLPFAAVGERSTIGLLANVGYAPSIALRYYKGAVFKGGFFYVLDLGSVPKFTVSGTYAYQQLKKKSNRFSAPRV
jgi:hypothetical protein